MEQARLNEKVVRLVSGMVALLALWILLGGPNWLALYLTVDFFFRAFTSQRPLFTRLAQFVLNAIHAEPKWIYAPPKKFAAGVGFTFSLAIFLSQLAGFIKIAYALTIVLLSCAVLESAFAICVGCYVYDWLVVPLKRTLN